MPRLLIGHVAKSTGMTPATIRYYESRGLLPAPPRSAGGYRHYTEASVRDLEFIRKAQGLGFTLDEVQEILELSRAGKSPCAHVLEAAQRHLAAVEERIAALSRFRRQLRSELARWASLDRLVCDGLCQMIAGASTLRPPLDFSSFETSRPARAAKRPGRRRSLNA